MDNKKKHPIDDVDLYGEQVREVLSKPPHWLTLSGSTLVFIFIISILLLAFYIKYPDVLHASITITSVNPPIPLIAKTNGRIEQIFVMDNDSVQENQILAIIENTASLADVNQLSEKLENFLHIIDNSPDQFSLPDTLELGIIQDAYATFKYDYELYQSYLKTNGTDKNVTLLQQQLLEHKVLLNKQKSQQENIEEELKILNAEMNRNVQLHEDGVISLKELEDKQRELLQVKTTKDNILIAQSNTQIAITSFKRNMLDLKINHSNSEEQLRFKVIESYQNLTNEIIEWQRLYIIKSPVAGIVSYFKYWSKNQNVQQGEDAFTILNNREIEYIGKALLPIQNTGKLKIGQKARIRLENYPYSEFGVLMGSVKRISSIPKQGNYAIEISFPQPLKSNTGFEFEFKDEIIGGVEIVTDDLRLLERIFYQLSEAFN